MHLQGRFRCENANVPGDGSSPSQRARSVAKQPQPIETAESLLMWSPFRSPSLNFKTNHHSALLIIHSLKHLAPQYSLNSSIPLLNPIKMRLSLTAAAALALLPSSVFSWGSLGHETVAYIASNFVSPPTEAYFQTLLLNTTSSYLANVATWADSFRYTAAGRFSAPFHYVDAEDDPPLSCGVKYSRDCGEKGCILVAIANYTSRLMDPDLPFWQRNQAAKFIIHFLGDIHQPLHDEALDTGGNGISVNFSGKVTNLHHVWDTEMPEKLIGGYSLFYANQWAASLTGAIVSGSYHDIASSWLDGIDLNEPVETSLKWAEEANAYVCTAVLPGGVEAIQGQELSSDYYESSIPVIQLQIARAGYRLAKWLDLIVAELQATAEDEL